MTAPAISYDDILSAARQIKGVAVRTPLYESPALNDRIGGRVFIKLENLQQTGAFKFRGAYNRLSRLNEDEKAAGVVAFSSGNHAQGVARAAQMLGIKATIVMPHDAPPLKVERTRGFGAEVVIYDRYKEDREAVARSVASDSGAVIVPPFNNEYVMAGQGTAGLEIAEDLNALGVVPDQVLVNCGGGGLASGIFTAMYHHFPEVQGYAVEPETMDDVKRSLETGTRQVIDPDARSICDALLTQSPGELTFSVLQHLGIKGLTVSDDDALKTVGYAARELKLVGEPGGVVSLAALLSGKMSGRDKVSVCIISGGNIDPALLKQCLDL
ncbi:threonine ammonia-lyase [Kordiimonas marina]|uniref:threonine ammonia-lyase n=1 Tax=Kordiimonas marina TaxID=2872312 RepID=UPI001FF3B9CB|nr:threonine/serine dehydratase [Kordiimonas marina]MCJ9430287.1 threonine/serine dehydratase [Kordiimonas marina]